MDPQGDEVLAPKLLERSESTMGMDSRGPLCSEQGETSDPSPQSIEEFIRDRFSTKLEDPRTGRMIR
jgi:hypothetical protein